MAIWRALASSSAPTSEFLKRERLQLTKTHVKEVERRREVKTDVSAGYHLTHFPEAVGLGACIRSEAFNGFIRALYS